MSMSDSNNKLLTWNNFFKLLLSLLVVISLIMFQPMISDINRTEGRVQTIEKKDLPQLREEQARLRVEMMEFRVRQESQIETLKKIADDVEYLRRRSEKGEQ
ncbi:MAG: hypothetical protein WC961_06935 [Anaerovoracaceae bacterium]